MKFIHVADIHASRERLSQTLSILETLTERAKKGDIDFILFAGDFWDSTITATKGSGFSDIIAAIRKLEANTSLYFIYGTPSHEPNGSLDAFASGKTYIFSTNCYKNEIFSVNKDFQKSDIPECDMYEFVFIPEPRRSNYITNSSKGTDEAINSDIKGFIASVEAKINAIPRIVVYHGEVKGAVYQNGVSASSPTAIPKELLESLHADYYALGHIHLPQEVFKNAWYAGSACPKNFGEPHDGCYNLVEIENGETKVERVSFGLPTYETYNVFFGDFTKTEADYSNKHIRLCFDCEKEQKKSLNIKQICNEIKERTHALSVKLEPTVIESETTERSEVVKHKSIVEKMTEYAKEKARIIPKYATELLQQIQDNTLVKLAYPQHSFELLSLSLRGAIGIRDGQQKEDFELNFEQYEDGVVCLEGANGRGKTTLVENCHPYPCMLTRDGTLKDHFYLKDSHRILTYKDENELFYKISMLIDGKTATGKVSYFVETSKDRESWKPLPEVDGSYEMYKQWVNSTFGSIDVFLRTAFFAKEQTKDATDISDTTKSERMELLSKLAGTDHLKEVSVIAREQRKEIEKTADKIETELESYSHFEDSIKENKEDITSWKNEIKGVIQNITSLEKEVIELRAKDAEYQKVKAVSEANSKLYDQYKKDFDETKQLFDKFDKVVENMSVYKQIEQNNLIIVDNAPIISSLIEQLNDLEKELSKKNKDVSLLNKVVSEYKVEYEKLKSEQRLLSSQIIAVTEVCPTCGAPLSEEKKAELQEHINATLNELKKVQRKVETQKELIDRAEHQLIEANKKVSELEEESAKIGSRLADLQSESQSCSEFIESVDEIYKEYIYDDAVEEHLKLSKELNELQSKMDDIADSKTVEDVSDKLRDTENRLQTEKNRQSELLAMIKAAEKENEKYQKEFDSVTDKKKELKEITEKVTAYNFIEEAFSNNGIPAIELRESAPEIADITNKILADSYGNKFEIRFGPTSDLKAKRKANEDFNIIVLDTENGDEKTIDLVSSGERIWIKQALFYAFSIVQMNRTGFNFRTRLIDESDGSLDGSLRPKYLNMVTSAHQIANSRITVLITHSQEIKDIAQQIIEI